VLREASLKAIRRAMENHRFVLVLSQRDMSQEEPGSKDLCSVGTISEVLQAIPLPDASLRVALRGVQRGKVTKVFSKGGCFWAQVEPLVDAPAEGVEVEALIRAAIDSFTRVVQLENSIPPESLQGLAQFDHPGQLADNILHHLPLRTAEKQSMLEELNPVARLEQVLAEPSEGSNPRSPRRSPAQGLLARADPVLPRPSGRWKDVDRTIHRRSDGP
jgi:ATP-dependent Lon protease